VQFALILTVASIPVAMPAVLSMTMAVGAMALAKRKAIVTRLESIEEIASMAVLCSDKTGTLTRNQLTLGETAFFGAPDDRSLLLNAALACREEDHDAIDDAILQGRRDGDELQDHQQLRFTRTKRTRRGFLMAFCRCSTHLGKTRRPWSRPHPSMVWPSKW